MDAIVISAWAARNRPRMVIRITAIEGLVAGGLYFGGGQFVTLAANEVAFVEARLTLFNLPAPA